MNKMVIKILVGTVAFSLLCGYSFAITNNTLVRSVIHGMQANQRDMYIKNGVIEYTYTEWRRGLSPNIIEQKIQTASSTIHNNIQMTLDIHEKTYLMHELDSLPENLWNQFGEKTIRQENKVAFNGARYYQYSKAIIKYMGEASTHSTGQVTRDTQLAYNGTVFKLINSSSRSAEIHTKKEFWNPFYGLGNLSFDSFDLDHCEIVPQVSNMKEKQIVLEIFNRKQTSYDHFIYLYLIPSKNYLIKKIQGFDENNFMNREMICSQETEILKNIYFPMQVSDTFYTSESTSRGNILVQQNYEVSNIRINYGIDNDIFNISIPAGYRVLDYRYDPPIEYTLKNRELSQSEADQLASEKHKLIDKVLYLPDGGKTYLYRNQEKDVKISVIHTYVYYGTLIVMFLLIGAAYYSYRKHLQE